MPYTITEAESPGIWQVLYEGAIDAATRQAAMAEGLQMTQGEKVAGILIDFRRAHFAGSVFDDFELGRRKARTGRYYGVRIAFLHLPGREQASAFLRTVMINRGLLAEVFVDREAAMHWLGARDPVADAKT